MDNQLKKLGTRLFVVRGNPKEVFENLFKEWNVKKLTYEKDGKMKSGMGGNNVK